MKPKNVRAEPYKINFYIKGSGHFTWHFDTPNENLVGTFLLRTSI